MSSDNKPETEFVRVDLTEKQKHDVKHATGHEVDSIELGVTELEQRIAPRISPRVTAM